MRKCKWVRDEKYNCSGFKQDWKVFFPPFIPCSIPLLFPRIIVREALILVWSSLEINSERIIDLLKVTLLINGTASLGHRCTGLRYYMRIIFFVVLLLDYNIRKVFSLCPLCPCLLCPWYNLRSIFLNVSEGTVYICKYRHRECMLMSAMAWHGISSQGFYSETPLF